MVIWQLLSWVEVFTIRIHHHMMLFRLEKLLKVNDTYICRNMSEDKDTPVPAPFHVSRDESFCQELLTSLHGLQQSQTLTDFTIRVGDRSFACHKLLLIAVCPYFAAMFRYNTAMFLANTLHVLSLAEITGTARMHTFEQLPHFFYLCNRCNDSNS